MAFKLNNSNSFFNSNESFRTDDSYHELLNDLGGPRNESSVKPIVDTNFDVSVQNKNTPFFTSNASNISSDVYKDSTKYSALSDTKFQPQAGVDPGFSLSESDTGQAASVRPFDGYMIAWKQDVSAQAEALFKS